MRKRLALGLVICAGLLGLAAFIIQRYHAARPRPTIAGWPAIVRTLAGAGAPGWHDDNDRGRARFQDPFGLAVDAAGNLYVADAGASNRVRRMTAQGGVTTLAGGAEGNADGAAAAAGFNSPSGLALDRAGNLYVADTGNNSIRKITPAGVVSTLAAAGQAGAAAESGAQFNGPVGVAIGPDGSVYVADTYNDRIRVIRNDGQVNTLAGGEAPGYADGPAAAARFDTPCALAVAADGTVFVADTGNDQLRKIGRDGQVSTLDLRAPDGLTPFPLAHPIGLALTHDNFLYVTEYERGRVLQVTPAGLTYVIAGGGAGFADGDGAAARFNRPTGLAVDTHGTLYVADSANYLVRQLAQAEQSGAQSGAQTSVQSGASTASTTSTASTAATQSPAAASGADVLPRLSAAQLGITELPWPLDPQRQRHEVVATMGEVRGSFASTDARDHLHSGVDVFGVYGATVRAIYDEKVVSPLGNWGFGSLNEGLRVGLFTYVHLRVGRDEKDAPLAGAPFQWIRDATGQPVRVRVRRGTRFQVGAALGTVNRMYHVHLNFGPPGAEANPLLLPLVGFRDTVAPHIEPAGIQLFDDAGVRLTTQRNGRLVVSGAVHIVVDAYDRNDDNQARRRLGLYRLGFQVLHTDGTPAPAFAAPRTTIEFDRLPAADDAVKIVYADASGITVYGNAATKFLYEVTNTVRAGRVARGSWATTELPSGDYILRISAADLVGNEAATGRDLPLTILNNGSGQ